MRGMWSSLMHTAAPYGPTAAGVVPQLAAHHPSGHHSTRPLSLAAPATRSCLPHLPRSVAVTGRTASTANSKSQSGCSSVATMARPRSNNNPNSTSMKQSMKSHDRAHSCLVSCVGRAGRQRRPNSRSRRNAPRGFRGSGRWRPRNSALGFLANRNGPLAAALMVS